MRKLFINTTVFVFFSATLVFGGDAIDFQSFFTVKRLGTPVVSPDGTHIAFTVKTAGIEENTFTNEIWLMNANGSDLRQLVRQHSTPSKPVFSPDGNSVYFLSNNSGTLQIWKTSLIEDEPVQITTVYGDLGGFVVGPDEKQFLLIRKVPPDCATEECIKQTGVKKNPVKARIIDHLMYRHWNEWLEENYSHLFLISSDGKIIKDLTPGPFHSPTIALGSSHDYCFSPDGKEIAYVTNLEINSAVSTNNDIFLQNTGSDKPEKISVSPGNDNNPNYSPDGKYIAFLSMQRAGFEADRQRIMVYDRTTKKTIELTDKFDLSATDLCWAPATAEIYFTAEEKGHSSVYKVSLASRQITPVLKGHDIKGIKFLNENQLVFLKQSTRMPFEVYIYQIENRVLSPLTHFNDELLAQFDLPSYQEFWFIGAGGDSIQGFIMKPPQFERGKKYPAVHMIHGGPQGMWSDEWHFRWNYQMFAAPGYAVYYINFHGSRGYGQKFTDSISRHWGDLPYEDLVSGTQYVIDNYDFIDADRLAAAGASYGGFMVNWIAGHENPYKCLISHDGTYEQVSMWGSTEELWFPEWELGGSPWEEGTDYDKWSPARLAMNFKTPTLVIHGEHDYRVPYTQGLQFFSALQRRGVPSRLLFFPDEDHFVQKPLNAQLWWKTVHEWLKTYLK